MVMSTEKTSGQSISNNGSGATLSIRNTKSVSKKSKPVINVRPVIMFLIPYVFFIYIFFLETFLFCSFVLLVLFLFACSLAARFGSLLFFCTAIIFFVTYFFPFEFWFFFWRGFCWCYLGSVDWLCVKLLLLKLLLFMRRKMKLALWLNYFTFEFIWKLTLLMGTQTHTHIHTHVHILHLKHSDSQ